MLLIGFIDLFTLSMEAKWVGPICQKVIFLGYLGQRTMKCHSSPRLAFGHFSRPTKIIPTHSSYSRSNRKS